MEELVSVLDLLQSLNIAFTSASQVLHRYCINCILGIEFCQIDMRTELVF